MLSPLMEAFFFLGYINNSAELIVWKGLLGLPPPPQIKTPHPCITLLTFLLKFNIRDKDEKIRTPGYFFETFEIFLMHDEMYVDLQSEFFETRFCVDYKKRTIFVLGSC